MIAALVEVLVAYGLGSVSGSLLLGRLRGVDIRTRGSGNAGGTNALRTLGPWFALGVVIVDVGKGALAAGLVPGLLDPATPGWTAACGFAAVFGHCYPVWHGFRGGKGAATAIGTLGAVAPWLLLPMFITWVLVLVLTGYVGLATVLAAASLVPAAWLGGAASAVLAYAVALALFIAFTHRANFQRLLAGTENRFERARITHWLGRRGSR
ncbi:MAG: glycerol-3-phosphate 1-O-acyltransferase PlsY [Gammaproteobacteria bacterium]